MHNKSGRGQAKAVALFLSFRAFNGLSAYKHDEEIKETINSAAREEVSPKASDWLAVYNRVASEMWEQLEDDEKEQWEELADEWNTKGAPPDVQAQYVYPISSFGVSIQRSGSFADTQLHRWSRQYIDVTWLYAGTVFYLLGLIPNDEGRTWKVLQ